MTQFPNNVNPDRRQFLKILLVGIGAFFLGKVFDPLIRFLGIFKSREVLIRPLPEPKKSLEVPEPVEKSLEVSETGTLEAAEEYGDWKVNEKGDTLIFHDQSGEEVLILDWGSRDK